MHYAFAQIAMFGQEGQALDQLLRKSVFELQIYSTLECVTIE
jgi:hypothetical protein